MTDKSAMKRALELAYKGTGLVSPNPRVGAVIIKDGSIISESFHRRFGEPHAEANAINQLSDEQVKGSTLVVNLEPCSHQGKNPPCADLIIEKGISRVVVGTLDPNPLVAGQGIEKLRQAGIEVETGVLENECLWANRFFFKHITSGLPYVVVKVAQSLNGMIATSTGQSKWITCEESRTRTHALRSEIDAVLIGKRTASIDNPELTVRNVMGRNPFRIVFDTHLTLPLSIRNFTDDQRKQTIVCCSHESSVTRKSETLRAAGLRIVPSQLDAFGKLELEPILRTLLSEYSIGSIMVEGGASIFSSFVASDLTDELHVFIAPMIIGNGLNAFASYKINFLNEAKHFAIKGISQCGKDIHVVAVREQK